jgi:hypothetical protein
LDEKKEKNLDNWMCYFGFCFAMDFFHLVQKQTMNKEKIVMGQSKWLLKMTLLEHASLTLDSTLASFD